MEKLLLKADEVAEALGISRTKAYRLIAEGVLPSVRVGEQRRVPADELQRWLRGVTHEVAPDDTAVA